VFPDGRLVVADRDNERIRVVRSDGTTQTLAGSGTTGGRNGRTLLESTLNSVQSVATDLEGRVVMSEEVRYVPTASLALSDRSSSRPCLSRDLSSPCSRHPPQPRSPVGPICCCCVFTPRSAQLQPFVNESDLPTAPSYVAVILGGSDGAAAAGGTWNPTTSLDGPPQFGFE
jgi:hypothetical protein